MVDTKSIALDLTINQRIHKLMNFEKGNDSGIIQNVSKDNSSNKNKNPPLAEIGFLPPKKIQKLEKDTENPEELSSKTSQDNTTQKLLQCFFELLSGQSKVTELLGDIRSLRRS